MPPILALLAQPVSGNPTQYMIEKAFAHHDLDWRYLSFEVGAEDLGYAIRGLKALGFAGKKKRKNPVTVHSPLKPVEIYGRLLRIEAQKGPGHVCDAKCKAAGHRYFHDFSKHAHVYGMPDGSLKIVDKT